MEKKTLHIIPHTHWDREWYMGFERHRARLTELMETLICTMEADPDYTYFHLDGQTIVIDDFLAVCPQMRERLLRLIRAGRIQIGPWYVLQDEYLISGEANVRDLLYGLRFCRELGAEPVMSGYFPDSFGNISQIPQILRGFGIDNAVFGRGAGEVGADNAVAANGNPSEWRWRAPDGSEVIGVMFSHWYHNAMELPTEKTALAARLHDLIESTSASAATPHLLGMNGCDHEPVQTDLVQAIRLSREILAGQDITVRQSNFGDYVDAIRPYADRFPVIRGELNGQRTGGFSLLIDTASTHVPLKQQNHEGQLLLTQQAEPIGVLSHLCGDTYRQDLLLYAWKKLMQNHPHDSICSCSVDEVTDEMRSRFARSRQVGEYVRDEAAAYLADRICAPEKGFLVCHGTAGKTAGTVSAYLDFPEGTQPVPLTVISPDGRRLPTQVQWLGRTFTYTLPKDRFRQVRYTERCKVTFPAEMTGVGYALYPVREEEPPKTSAVTVFPDGAQTDSIAFKIDDDGTLTVTDRRSGAVYAGLNLYEDAADTGDSYNYAPLPGEVPLTSRQGKARIWIRESTPFSVTFGVERHMAIPLALENGARTAETADTVLTAFVTLTAGIHRVDIALHYRNGSRDHRLRVLFPTDIRTDIGLADGQFDLVERDIVPWEKWENPSNSQRCQAFFALEDGRHGLAVAGRGLHAYEILRDKQTGQNTMALTLLRCVGRMGDWGEFPAPHMQCIGEQHAEYAIVPYAAAERAAAFAEARAFSGSDLFAVQAQPAQPHGGTLPAAQTLCSVEDPVLVTSAVKRSEDGSGIVLRLYDPLSEPVSTTLTLAPQVRRIWQADLAENKLCPLEIRENTVPLTVPAKKIVTYLLELD